MSVRLKDLVDSILERFNDSMQDVKKVVDCLQRHSDNPQQAETCILEKLKEEVKPI